MRPGTVLSRAASVLCPADADLILKEDRYGGQRGKNDKIHRMATEKIQNKRKTEEKRKQRKEKMMRYGSGDPHTLDKIRNTIREYSMILPGERIVAGLSGGPDSACLLHALCCLREELAIGAICAVHVNHGLREDEAQRDEAYSRQLAEDLGADFRVFHFDIGAEAAQERVSSETAGRKARYRAFETACADFGAERIATAHNSNDQAETILMRILRGTGIHGLSGIRHCRRAGRRTVIRPLLDIGREEIEAYCRSCGLIPVRDHTNDEAVYTRNKIRLELLPYLRENYNPDISSALVRLGRLAADDDDYLEQVTGKIMLKHWNQEEKTLSADALPGLHPALAKRAVREAAGRSGADSDLGEKHIRGVLSLASGKKEGKETDLTGGYYVRYSYAKLWFLRRTDRIPAEDTAGRTGFTCTASFPEERLEKNGTAEIFLGGRAVKLRLIRSAEEKEAEKEAAGSGKRCSAGGKSGRGGAVFSRTVCLDWKKLKEQDNVIFRFRQPGDRIRPRGMKGHKKLQDFFVDRRIPKHLREQVPLLASGREILSAGGEAAQDCCPDPESTAIVSIEY